MPVIAVTAFERFFRTAAGLDVDRQDLKRYQDFVTRKTVDLLVRGEAAAKANGRDIIEPQDLPITKGLQESIQAFKKLEAEADLALPLDRLTPRPPLDLALGDEAEAQLPQIVGGLSLALARSFTILDPGLKNPATEHWDRSFHMFDLLL